MEVNYVSVIFMILCVASTVALFIKRENPFIDYLVIAIGFIELFITGMYLKIASVILVIASFLIGYLLYIVSLFIVGTKRNIKNLFLRQKIAIQDLKIKRRRELLRNLKSSLIEELIYRGVIQYTLSSLLPISLLTIILSAIFFTLSHYRKNIARIQMIDVFVFSIVITIVFQITFNIYVVVIIHIMRNVFIIMQKYVHLQKEHNRNLRIKYLIQKEFYKNEGKISIKPDSFV